MPVRKSQRFDEKTRLKKFWEKVDIRGKDECWPWLGARNYKGYGSIGIGEPKTMAAHRFAFLTVKGNKLRKGEQVLHRCDNPPCVNPKHLFKGNNAMNVADKLAKGRGHGWNCNQGEAHGYHKLINEQVRLIRSSLETHRVLAARFSVSSATISRVKTYATWRHI